MEATVSWIASSGQVVCWASNLTPLGRYAGAAPVAGLPPPPLIAAMSSMS